MITVEVEIVGLCCISMYFNLPEAEIQSELYHKLFWCSYAATLIPGLKENFSKVEVFK